MDENLVINLRAVVAALEDVEVKGKNNMEKLLASINHLTKIINGEIGSYVLKPKE